MSTLIHIDSEYKQWIQTLSKRYRQSQIKAAVHVNHEMLAYYWELGRDIVQLQAEQRWGSGFMRSLAQDLQQELPDATGLTRTNLYYCKKFYLLYNEDVIKFPQVGGKLKSGKGPKCETFRVDRRVSGTVSHPFCKCDDNEEKDWRLKWELATLGLATLTHWQH